MIEVAKSMMSKPDTVKSLIDLFIECFQDDQVSNSLSELLGGCFHNVLLDTETTDKFKIFFYNLMAIELEDSKGKKTSLLDLMLTKTAAKHPQHLERIKEIIENNRKPVHDLSMPDILAKTIPVDIEVPRSSTEQEVHHFISGSPSMNEKSL